MNNAQIKICYFCGELATSKEHVPPQGLFPKKDIYRNNLITVPSCTLHNNSKSTLDNKMLVFLSGVNKSVFHEKDFKEVRDRTIRAIVRDSTIFNDLTDDARVFKRKDKRNELIIPSTENIEAKIDFRQHS
ncbi:TPA: hypothetical protein L9052_002240, partial [Klebsiella pneumoniae]|nr:hypothetical protein [Klebsiella pneumoniae]